MDQIGEENFALVKFLKLFTTFTYLLHLLILLPFYHDYLLHLQIFTAFTNFYSNENLILWNLGKFTVCKKKLFCGKFTMVKLSYDTLKGGD